MPPHCPVFPALRLVSLRLALGSLAFVIIAGLIPPGTVLAAPQSAAQVEAELKEAARKLDLQQKLPDEVVRDFDIQSELPKDDQWRLPDLSLPPGFFWAAIGVGAVLLAWALKDVVPAFFARGDREWDEVAASEGENGAAEAVQAAVAADDLARQGRFAEAMHVLLLRGLADIRRHLDERFANSQTSRGILRSARLSDLGRSALRDIVSRVELTYFGEYPAAQDDYQACRASFTQLTLALGGPAIA